MSELPIPPFMNRTLAELRVGTYDNICTVTENTPIIQALKLFVQKRVSALPVLDPQTGINICHSDREFDKQVILVGSACFKCDSGKP